MRNPLSFLALGVLPALALGIDGASSIEMPKRDEGVEIEINTKNVELRNNTAPDLYGIMFEDINHSGDGGIYAELIVNRAFQGSNIVTGSVPNIDGNVITSSENEDLPYGPVITGWGPIGNVRMSLDTLHPLSDALQTVLQVDIPLNATGEVGIVNYGWWGMDVRPQTYNASFYVLANTARYKSSSTTFKVSIRSNLTGQVWASTEIPDVKVDTVDYVQVAASIVNTATAPNSNNSFAITMDGAKVAGHTFYFDLVSLFPETFKNRKNGLRKDIAQAYYDMKPRFLRFPGGNNMEGVSKFRRWKWWETIGPLKDRPGRQGNWDYYNTDGLGLLEYLEWCEDMEIEPILGIYAGYSLDIYGLQGTSYPESRMGEVLQEALDELEYIMGDTSTKYGAMRARDGHPEPFKLKYVEVGNEDWFSETYPYRWPIMYKGLKAAHPNLTIISSTFNENANYNISLPPGTIWDTHHYEQPHYFLERFDFYDNWQAETKNPGVGVFLGEYSVFEVDSPSGSVNWSDTRGPNHMFYPTMVSAVAEGVYALGGERNPNTVKLSSYAPTLQNLNWWNWVPNMIAFTANHDELVLSASYWQQRMFAHFRGTQTLPVTNTKGDFNPLFWAASIDGPTNAVYLKVINAENATVPLLVNLDVDFKSVNGTILHADDPMAFNFLGHLDDIRPRALDFSDVKDSGDGFLWGVPGKSIAVLQFNL